MPDPILEQRIADQIAASAQRCIACAASIEATAAYVVESKRLIAQSRIVLEWSDPLP